MENVSSGSSINIMPKDSGQELNEETPTGSVMQGKLYVPHDNSHILKSNLLLCLILLIDEVGSASIPDKAEVSSL